MFCCSTVYCNYFSIFGYSTASTKDAVFIIGGGSDYRKRIAEYKNGKWTNVGKLEKWRSYIRSITFGGLTMIIDALDPTVEIWNLEQSKKLTTFERPKNLVRPHYEFYEGFEVFLIPKNFC